MTLVEEEHFLALDPKPWVSLGVPFAEACAHHASLTFRAKRVYLIISSSISKTPALRSLKAALGDNIVGIRYRIRQHVPWPDVLEVAVELRDLDADLIVTLGAGSLTDAAKVASFAVVKGAFSLDALDKIHIRNADPSKLKPCTIPIINIPTSLSGGEYNPPGGATDLRNSRKTSFNHGSMGAQLVILDPELTVSTPERVWLSSGMRAVDHCIEGLCSVAFRDGDTAGSGKVDRHLLKGLRLLLRSLLTTKHNPGDLEARKREMGVIEAMRGLTRGVPMGASHGIGHQLGPLGVGHGETSCVMLPSVLRWNLKNQGEGEKWVRERLLKVLDAFWEDATVAKALEVRGPVTGSIECWRCCRCIFRGIGVAWKFDGRQVGGSGKKFHDGSMHSNESCGHYRGGPNFGNFGDGTHCGVSIRRRGSKYGEGVRDCEHEKILFYQATKIRNSSQ